MSKIIEINNTNFEQEKTSASTPTFIDYRDPCCGHYRKQLPIVKNIANNNRKVTMQRTAIN